jgi:CDP-diacylglycerol--serine O-phosphatidyltransferase
MYKKEKATELFPIVKLLPNVVTIIGLCVGLFALKCAISQAWEMAVGLIVLATFIDGIDGRLARMLNASSDFGAQLDSLADFFNFGVAPALVLYMWIMHDIKGLGWTIALFFVVTQALRLARFNCSIDSNNEGSFFAGVPAPCGAGLSLLPMMLVFMFDKHLGYQPFEIKPLMVIIYTSVIALLMVSRVPTISVKKMKINRRFAPLFLASAGLFIAVLVVEPWVVLPILGGAYLLSIPFSVISYLKKQ